MQMIKYAVIILLLVLSLVLMWTKKKLCCVIFKTTEPSSDNILKIQLAALIIGITAFLLALLLI